jgi:hypothetical protein
MNIRDELVMVSSSDQVYTGAKDSGTYVTLRVCIGYTSSRTVAFENTVTGLGIVDAADSVRPRGG